MTETTRAPENRKPSGDPSRFTIDRRPAIPVLGFCRRGDGIATLTELNKKAGA